MINLFKQTGLVLLNANACILQISFNKEFAADLCHYDNTPFDLAESTFGGIPCAIRLNQAAPFLITIQGGKK